VILSQDSLIQMIRRRWPWLLAAAFYTSLACARFWPLLRDAGAAVTRPGDDALLNTWILWWNVHAVPFTNAWWNAPIFYPVHGAMAFSELLLGELPIAAPVMWLTGNPVLAYNTAVLLSFPLCALAAHALAYELTRRHDAATLAALVFGFGAIRANHIGHLQMLSYYWAPLALFCLHRSLRGSRRAWWLAASAAACLLQVLCNGYALFQLTILVFAWIIWFPPTVRSRLAALTAVGVGLLPLVPVLLRYRAIHANFGFERSITEIRLLSPDISTLFQAPADNVVLGKLISAWPSPGLFPGLTVAALLITAIVVAARHRSGLALRLTWDRAALAAIALVAAAVATSEYVFGQWAIGALTLSHPHKPLGVAIYAAAAYFARGPRWRHVWRSKSAVGFYALSAVLFFLLAFGPEPRLWGERVFYQAPYAWLLRVPGFSAIRAPDRMALLAILCLSVVVAATYVRWASTIRKQRLLWLVLCAGLVFDGWFTVHTQTLPSLGPTQPWRDVEAVVELPLTSVTDTSAMYRSMRRGPPILNGASGYAPPHYPLLREVLNNGEFGVLQHLGLNGSLGVAVDRAAPDASGVELAIAHLPGTTLLDQTRHWTRYRVPQEIDPVTVGAAVTIAHVTAHPSPDQAARMIDGRSDTAWSSPRHSGDEEIVVELSAPGDVSAVRMQLGNGWFSFPRELSIETSMEGSIWTEVWRGTTESTVTRRALDSPLDLHFIIWFEPTTARKVRLRELWAGGGDSWTIAEVSVLRRR
jgi:F5/8 type C domain-containing protein